MKKICLGTLLIFTLLVGGYSDSYAGEKDHDEEQVSTAVRGIHFHLRSPRVMGSAFFDLVWVDATDAINEEIYWNLREDDPKPDGYSDMSILFHFDKGKLIATDGLCDHDKKKGKGCKPSKKDTFYKSEIVALDPEEYWGYEYVTVPEKISLDVIGVKIKSDYGQVLFVLDEEANVMRGMIFCFLSYKNAKKHRMPYWLAYVGDKTLDRVLRSEDLKKGDKGEDGWWFVFDFAAAPVTFVK